MRAFLFTLTCASVALAANSSSSDVLNTYERQALAFAQKQRWDLAIPLYRKALDLAPDSADDHYNLGLALKYKGELAAARAELLRAVALKGDWSAAHSALGAVDCELKDISQGKAELRSAIEMDPRKRQSASISRRCSITRRKDR